MPAPIPRSAVAKADSGPSGPLSIVLSCPKCGAPFHVDDAVVSVSCAHCSSLLILAAPERDEIYLAEGVTRGASDIREIVISYRVQSERAEIVSRHSDSEGNPPSDFFVQMRLEPF